jgi:HEAT repeats
MMRNSSTLFVAACSVAFAAQPALAYVDLAPTLARIVREAKTITIAEVDAFNPEKGAVILKKIRDLKGETGADALKHQLIRADELAIDAPIAEPGRRCVLFVTDKAAVVCVGEGWYQAYAADNGWWRIGAPRPDLPLAYYGSVSRLADALPPILAGKSAIITALPHGANREGASFDLALNRANLPGFVKVQRLLASNKMPEMAMGVGSNTAFVTGMGRVAKSDLPALREKLQSPEPAVRAESAIDLGFLGADAVDASKDLAALLEDKTPRVRVAAAAALLRINGKHEPALAVLSNALTDVHAATRRQAARAAGLAGPAAAPLASKLADLLKDSDTRVRRAALQAIATLGPAAAQAREQVTALLERPETAIDAADALGRMGTAARPSMKAIARLLSADPPAEKWAAVRAMSQIGGPDADPAVQFMITQLPKANEADGYNMMIYLSLLGPVAKDAIPAIKTSRVRNPILRQTTTWAIDPTGDLPAMGGFGPFGGGFGDQPDFTQYILEAYVQELGDNLKPAAVTLAKKIMTGKASTVPPWGYKLLARFPNESLEILTPGLADEKLVMRERATVAIGYMGRTAKSARPQVAQALKSSTDEREQLLLRWCLSELE